MKVTIVGTLPPIKGISEYCIEQANSLSKKAEIEFINFKSIYPEFLYPGGTKEFDPEFTIKKNKKLQIRNILTWYNPLSWLHAGLSLQGDLLHIHWWTFYLFPVLFTIAVCVKIRRKKIILTVHNVVGHESGTIDVLFSGLMYRMADAFIIHSDTNRQTLTKRFLIPPKNISIIPYGTLTFYNQHPVTKRRARKYFRLQNDQKVILFFGTIRKYKGLDVLIRAFFMVRQSIQGVTLLIAGECWEDWQYYNELIEQLSLSEAVIPFIRYIPTSEVQYYYIASDLLVLPYCHFESQSGPGTIGLSFGKAMIVSNAGSLPLLVKNKNCVVSTQNAREYAEAILTVLQNTRFQRELEDDSRLLSTAYASSKSAKMTYGLYKSLRRAE